MKVISLFDGISCGLVALKQLGIKPEIYQAAEIKKVAIKVSKDNHPEINHVGDITLYHPSIGQVDLLLGGSPCQNLSIANQISPYGLKGDKSKLFYEFIRILNLTKPDFFLFENVKMSQDNQNIISKELGVKPILINSNLVSYQNRKRLYWTNIPNIEQPEDQKINFQDFKDADYTYCKQFKVNKTKSRIEMWEKGCPNVTHAQKINCLTTKQDRWGNSGLIEFEDFCRYLTTHELEQAQNLPKGYTKSITKNQAENVLGDGWTVNVIIHILKNLP